LPPFIQDEDIDMRTHNAILSQLPIVDEGTKALRFIIETPKGSRNKYTYRPDGGYFELSAVMPEGMTFPFDFGFIPSTLGEDGDPLDVLVLMDTPVAPGIVIPGRLIGAIIASQKEKDKWTRNDRLIGVASNARTHQHVQTLRDLHANALHDIEAFFINYNAIRGRKFKVEKECGPERAQKLIDEGKKAFKKESRSR
jgi:inorganic pyrophosphatase